ncbi:MAG: radical SAM protein [Sphaerochaetaceae bacterium]|nr:radical SAM protein [Sphaerochaetaceae bacterium]
MFKKGGGLIKMSIVRSFTIDWRITSKCNNRCAYCYASKKIRSVNIKGIDRIIDGISKTDCKAVCITGGEPLMHDNVYYIIKRLYNLGIPIYLSTNGTNYLENVDKIEPYISRLSLSLDGYDSDSNIINGRRIDSFNTVKKILDYYKVNNPNFDIKIGTVLTRKNMSYAHFEKMYEFLIQYPIKNWRIYELVPEQSGLELFKNYGYKKKDFLEFKKNLSEILYKKENRLFSCIHFSSRNERNGAYCMIRADGKVFVPLDKGDSVDEYLLGNALTDSLQSIIELWWFQRENIFNK